MSLLSATMLLFLVLDPFGNIPFFLCVLKNVSAERRQRIIVREMLIALLALVIFLFTGHFLLDMLGISEPAMGMAGGVVLFLIAIKMIFGATGQVFSSETDAEPLIVPLAIPAVAGPSSMATVILLRAREPARWPEWLVAVLVAWFLSSLIVLVSAKLNRILGQRGLAALERLMGMILTTIAVEMFLDGAQAFIKTV
jgi:multiple antibiotic resistance protein